MGELLLCNEQIGAMPYYIEGISLNVYSIEELCYYIANNVYLIDSDFMNEELITWLEKELTLRSLANELRDIIRDNGHLSEFIQAILEEACYLAPFQVEEVVSILSQMEEKSEFECDKMRADRLMEKDKYLSSIYAYKHLLDSDDASQADPIVVGNILHNLGTAYARLFMYREAAEYYEAAYKKNQDPETLKEWLFTFRCVHDEEGFTNLALEHGFDDMAMQELKNELSLYSRSQEIKEFESQLEVYTNEINQGNRDNFAKEAKDLLNKWKDEYRRICRV